MSTRWPRRMEGESLLRSQHELHAVASMVVASLPFPPLPVMVLQGEGGADGMASSFDLLQTAVVNWQLGLRPEGKEVEEVARSKQARLERLQKDMAAHHAAAGGATCNEAWLQRAYEIYCAAFRDYLLDHYGTSSRDLRFHPADAVAADSVLVQQGTSQWQASRLLAGDWRRPTGIDDTAPWLRKGCSGARFSSYKQMLRAYALDLATLPES
jgi:hypothetical protein